eukprot:TRINITY_DN1996_c0_g2_i3.p1 TRINITY_DN1996_c0_g2~~TRINITY_DN1996_c0_g2_i3.p1  ORF type:complete len:483 (+),score=59.69 TRINITY_DN1996_c0_g2_i3:692-2140(+)
MLSQFPRVNRTARNRRITTATVKFGTKSVFIGREIVVIITLLSHISLDVPIKSVRMTFNQVYCQQDCTNDSPVTLRPNTPLQLKISVPASSLCQNLSVVDTTLEIDANVFFKTEFDVKAIDAARCDVVENPTQVTLFAAHQPPALVCEFYRINATVTNGENFPIRGVLAVGSTSDVRISLPGEKKPFSRHDLGKIPAQSSKTIPIVCYFLNPGPTKLLFQLRPPEEEDTANDTPINSVTLSHTVEISVEQPFLFRYEVLNKSTLERMGDMVPNSDFILSVDIMSNVMTKLRVVDMYIQTKTERIDCIGHDQIQQREIYLVQKQAKERIFFHFKRIPAAAALCVEWTRYGEEDRIAVCEHPLPAMTKAKENFTVKLDTGGAAFGHVGSIIRLTAAISNHTRKVQDILFRVHDNDLFLFAGRRKTQVSIPPKSIKEIYLELVPVVTGHLEIPRIHVKAVKLKTTVPVPPNYSIFVKPQKCVQPS